MAFQSRGPVMLAMPPFYGVTRKLLLAGIAAYIVQNIVGPVILRAPLDLALSPHLAFFARPWLFVTYGFLAAGLLNTAFGLLSLWYFGAAIESDRGGRWLAEYFFVTAIGGGLLASALSYTRIVGISPDNYVFGLWPVLLALLLAYARLNPEAELRLYFVLTVKARHLLVVAVLFYLVSALVSHDNFSAVTALCAALCGFLYFRFVPRRGLTFAASEGWFSMRNAYYRAKRRRAAKKFTVYMKKQGRDVNLDASGKYVALDEERNDPNDKRWMN